MSTDRGPAAVRRRAAVVLARHGAARAAPEGVDPDELQRAALADTYEVVADLVDVRSGIAGDASVADLLWPGALQLPDLGAVELAQRLAPDVDELVLVPGDAPDLPALVLAKVFKVLHRTDVAVAPERGGPGCVALGLRLPLAPWLRGEVLDLDQDPSERLLARAPRRAACQRTPDWHRLRTPAAVLRLDPGLEGWEETRVLLADAAVVPW
jgi:hypothetical protein